MRLRQGVFEKRPRKIIGMPMAVESTSACQFDQGDSPFFRRRFPAGFPPSKNSLKARTKVPDQRTTVVANDFQRRG